MHGMVFTELKKFVVTSFGPATWNDVLEGAGNGGRVYLPSRAYGDEEMLRLLAAATEITGRPVGDLVEAFGTFLVPGLLRAYGAHLNPAWRTLDVLQHTEETIHRVVRTSTPGSTPPRLKVERTSPREVVIVYRSPRRLCRLARGIVHGIAHHYGEAIALTEPHCMHRGDESCQIHVAA